MTEKFGFWAFSPVGRGGGGGFSGRRSRSGRAVVAQPVFPDLVVQCRFDDG